MDRFIARLPDINNLFDSKQINIYDEYLCDIDCVRDLAFPTDITHHLNNLILELQGKNQTILTTYTAVKFPLPKAKHLAQIFSVDCARLEIDLIDLQSSPTESTLDWRNVTQYYIRLLAAKIVSFFNSTYTCEVTFVAMKTVKCNTRSHFTDENLENEPRCSITF